MRSDIVNIDNTGKGFQSAIDQTKKVAAYKGLGELETIQLQVLTEEMLSLTRSLAGSVKASFWIEFEGNQFDLHLNTKAVLNKENREALIDSSSSRKNEAAKTFLGRLKDRIEAAMAADVDHYEPTDDILKDLPHGVYNDPEWDGYERSILRTLADDIRIGIDGENVDITVSKGFSTPE